MAHYFINRRTLWVLYGALKEDMIITGANSIGVSLNVLLLILKLNIVRHFLSLVNSVKAEKSTNGRYAAIQEPDDIPSGSTGISFLIQYQNFSRK